MEKKEMKEGPVIMDAEGMRRTCSVTVAAQGMFSCVCRNPILSMA